MSVLTAFFLPNLLYESVGWTCLEKINWKQLRNVCSMVEWQAQEWRDAHSERKEWKFEDEK